MDLYTHVIPVTQKAIAEKIDNLLITENTPFL